MCLDKNLRRSLLILCQCWEVHLMLHSWQIQYYVQPLTNLQFLVTSLVSLSSFILSSWSGNTIKFDMLFAVQVVDNLKTNQIKRHFFCEYICVCLNVGVIGVDISRTQCPFLLADFWNMTSLMPLSYSMHIYFWAQRYYICMVICVCHGSCVFLSYPPIHLLHTDSKHYNT